MHDKYLILFKELTRSMEVLAERVMDYNHKKNDAEGLKTAQIMRDDYQNLNDRLRDENFDIQTLTKSDFAKFLVAAFVIVQNIEDKIKSEQIAINSYKIDVIPKLERIVNNTQTDEEALKLASEIFQILD